MPQTLNHRFIEPDAVLYDLVSSVRLVNWYPWYKFVPLTTLGYLLTNLSKLGTVHTIHYFELTPPGLGTNHFFPLPFSLFV